MRKSLDFELNLLPVISLLAVVISFLLITVVWVPIGSVDIKQSVGTAEVDDTKAESLWIQFEKNGNLTITAKDSQMQSVGSAIKTRNLLGQSWKTSVNTLLTRNSNIKSAIVAPTLNTSFENIILVMDEIKAIKELDVGIAPI